MSKENDGITHYEIDGVIHYNMDDLRKEFDDTSKKQPEDKVIESIKIRRSPVYDEMIYLRLEALKIAKDISISLHNNKDSMNLSNNDDESDEKFITGLYSGLDIVHRIADYNLKYILGGN